MAVAICVKCGKENKPWTGSSDVNEYFCEKCNKEDKDMIADS